MKTNRELFLVYNLFKKEKAVTVAPTQTNSRVPAEQLTIGHRGCSLLPTVFTAPCTLNNCQQAGESPAVLGQLTQQNARKSLTYKN